MTYRCKPFTLVYLIGFVALPGFAQAENEPVDIKEITKDWKCKFCPDLSEKKWEGYISAGAAYVTNDSHKFGEYNGLNEKGAAVAIDFDNQYRDEEGTYWNIRGEHLGLDLPHLGIEGGNQGHYRIKLDIDQTTHYTYDTGRTPYRGGSTQTLPAGWVDAANTSGFTALAASSHDVDFSTKRKSFKLSGEYFATPKWSYEATFKRQVKEGYRPNAFSFGFTRAVILPSPIDFTTDDMELKANYQATEFTGQIALISSKFENANKYFRWDNAYDSPATATQGQAATEPDNEKLQLMLMGSYTGIKDMQLTGLFSYAQLSQNEVYLPYTVNTGLAPPNLPVTSLDGKVNVINTNLAAHWLYSPQQTWHASFEHYEQDNATARHTYTFVTGDDTITTSPRANFPYGFRQQKLKVDTDYRFENQSKLNGGGQYSRVDRDYQSVETTEEKLVWLKFKDKKRGSVQYGVKAELSERSVDNYNVANEVTPAENPLMRKYNIADRSGQKLAFNLHQSASAAFSTNLTADYSQYDYDDTSIGLTQSDEIAVGVDLNYMASKDLGFSGFAHHTTITSQQANSAAYSTPDWTAENEDRVLTLGIGSNYTVIENKLKITLDYVHAQSNSAVKLSTGSPFPDLKTTRDTVTLAADYSIDKNLSLKASYQYEEYDENDWYIDNVTQTTLGNVLALGNTAPHYRIGVFWLTVRYGF